MAKQREAFWRLVFSGHFTYSEVAGMDWDDFWEAYAAVKEFGPKPPKTKGPKKSVK